MTWFLGDLPLFVLVTVVRMAMLAVERFHDSRKVGV